MLKNKIFISTFFVFAIFFVLGICPIFGDTISVNIKGFDDGIKTNNQQDYKEAVLFAMREAIERAGVEISSTTKVVDFKLKYDAVENQAKAVLLPGYNIIDIGYGEDGYYKIVLIGKIQKEIQNEYGFILLPVGQIYDDRPYDRDMDIDKWKIDDMPLKNYSKANEFIEKNSKGAWEDIYWEIKVPKGKRKITCLNRSTYYNINSNENLKIGTFDFQDW